MKNIMKKAHQMTREIVSKYGDVDYKVQFGLCLAYLLEKREEEQMQVKEFEKGFFKFQYINGFNATHNIAISMKRWRAYGKDRVYFREEQQRISKQIGYYDVVADKFYIDYAGANWDLYSEFKKAAIEAMTA